MNKINYFARVLDSTSEQNRIEINDDSIKIKHRVKFFRDETEVKRYSEVDKVDKSRNSAKIYLYIDREGRKNYEEDEGIKITFWLKKEAWESKEKWKKNLREACINFLGNRELSGLELNKKCDCEGTDIGYSFENWNNGQVLLAVFKEGEQGSVNIDNNNVTEIEPRFFQLIPFTLEDTIYYQNIKNPQPGSGTFWTGGKIFLITVISAVILLLIIFWKKIWRWIKGESSQEKKVREQIDIF